MDPVDGAGPTERFTSRAEAYARYRPGYPAAAVDAVLEGLGGSSVREDGRVVWPGVAADVGAGTGIFSRLLAGRGATVWAVEPNVAMREAGGAVGGGGDGADGVRWRAGTGEATGLEAGSVGLVSCAQAFHWLDGERALEEFARVLAPGGRVALVWNVREGGAFLDGYAALIGAHAGANVSGTWLEGVDVEALLGGWFGGARSAVFGHGEWMDAAGVLGRAMSASYVPNRGWARERFEGELMALFARHAERGDDGVERVWWGHETRVFLAESG